MEFSHQTRGLGHVADSNSIPQNRPHHLSSSPDCINTLLKYLLLLVERLFQRCHLSRIDEVLKCGDSMINLHTLSQIPLSVQTTFGVCGSKNFDKLFSVSFLHIKECLLLSSVASFEDSSNIFRTRSFTLCKNDLGFNERSDSVTVLESISSSSTINLSVCAVWTNWLDVHSQVSPFLLPALHQTSTLEKTFFRHHFIMSSLMSKHPLQVSPFLAAAQSTSSEVFDFHIWFSLRAFRCSRSKHIRIPHTVSGYQISSSASILLWLFLDLHLLAFFSTSLQDNWSNWEWLTLNKHKRWFQSSRVKFPFVSMSASWFLVSMY